MAKAKLQFTKKDLQRATDSRSWERGVGYFEDGRVGSLMVDGGVIHARVAGNEDYRIQVWMERGQIEGECSCPMGDDGVFCKHCVAVGLAFLAGRAEYIDGGGAVAAKKRSSRQEKEITADHVRDYLAGQDKERLVELIMERLPWDDELRQKLFLRAAHGGEGGLNVSAYRKGSRRNNLNKLLLRTAGGFRC